MSNTHIPELLISLKIERWLMAITAFCKMKNQWWKIWTILNFFRSSTVSTRILGMNNWIAAWRSGCRLKNNIMERRVFSGIVCVKKRWNLISIIMPIVVPMMIVTHVAWWYRCRSWHSVRCAETLTAALTPFLITWINQFRFTIRIYSPKTAFAWFILWSGHFYKVSEIANDWHWNDIRAMPLSRLSTTTGLLAYLNLNYDVLNSANPCWPPYDNMDNALI